MARKYLPTLGELIDRLTIVQLKMNLSIIAGYINP